MLNVSLKKKENLVFCDIENLEISLVIARIYIPSLNETHQNVIKQQRKFQIKLNTNLLTTRMTNILSH